MHPKQSFFSSKAGLGFFGVKGFDRQGDCRIHIHSLAGLLQADHKEPSLDYESIMKVIFYLTKDIRPCEILFRNTVFNVLSQIRDDHSKNFSFLIDPQGHWTVTPAYDLTFSSDSAGEHSTMIMGEGRNPTKTHLLKLAGIGTIQQHKALEIIHQVLTATEEWKDLARETGVSMVQTKNIVEVLNTIRKNGDF